MPSSATASAAEIVRRLDEAVGHHRAGDLAMAARLYRAILDRTPAVVPALRNLAAIEAVAGQPARARRLGRAAIAVHPGDGHGLFNLGNLLGRSGEPRAAETAYRRALATQPDLAGARYNLAALLRDTGRVEEAAAAFAALATGSPGDARLWNGLGTCRAIAGDRAGALTALRRAAALAPGSGEFLANLGSQLAAARSGGAARRTYERAVRSAPDSSLAWGNLANLLMAASKSGGSGRALAARRRVVLLVPGDGAALFQAHEAAAATGDVALADRLAERAILAAPELHRIERRFRQLWDAGRTEDAARLHGRHAALLAGSPHDGQYRGDLALARGRAAAAVPLYEATIRETGFASLRALAHLSLALQLAGDEGGAARLLDYERLVHVLRPFDGWPADLREALDRELAATVRGEQSLEREPAGYAVTGGALTQNLLDRPAPAIERFRAALDPLLRRFVEALAPDPGHLFLAHRMAGFRLVLWGTLLPAGGTIDSHVHDGGWWTGVYYPELPAGLEAQGRDAGALEFGHPPPGLPCPAAPRVWVVRPRVGDLVLFPGYLYHRTRPFAGGAERISLAFDLQPA